jgi:hypothetical protein
VKLESLADGHTRNSNSVFRGLRKPIASFDHVLGHDDDDDDDDGGGGSRTRVGGPLLEDAPDDPDLATLEAEQSALKQRHKQTVDRPDERRSSIPAS